MEPAIGSVPAHLGGEDSFDSPYYDNDDEDYMYPHGLEGRWVRQPAKADAPEIWPALLDIHRSVDRNIGWQLQTEDKKMMEPVELDDIVYTKQQWEQIQR